MYDLEFLDTDRDRNLITFNPEKEGYILYTLNYKPKEYSREFRYTTSSGRFEIAGIMGIVHRSARD